MKALIILFLFLSLLQRNIEIPTGIFTSSVGKDQIYWKLTRDSNAVILEVLTGKKKVEQYFAEEREDSLIFKNIALFQEPMDFYFSTEESGTFELKNYSVKRIVPLERLTQRTDFELSDVPKLIKRDLDLDLIGDWIILHLLNPAGGLADFELTGKDYKVGFSASGNWVLDPRAFNEQLPISGGGGFSFSDVPRATWKAKDGMLEVLIDMPGVSSPGLSTSSFLIRNDTLYTTSPQGYTTVHLRKQ
jgi:hypothetical protein